LERRLAAGEFVVTSEIAPPLSIRTDKLIHNIEATRHYVTALNFTDNASAVPRMTSWACSQIALEHEAEPVLQISARNRSRGNLQSEVIGATALGVRNILCVTGDSAKLSPSPRERMEINDLDAIQMLWILRRMRDEGKYLDGREIKYPPKFFLGAAASPFSSDPRFQALREQKKVNAGAQFFQTNLVFDINGMELWLNELAKRNVLDKVYILIGITPIKSLKMAAMLSEVPGVYVPEKIMRRMEAAHITGNAQEEGVQIALELISYIKRYHGQGIHGIHLMPVGWDEIVPRIVMESGLMPKEYMFNQTSQQEWNNAHPIEK
jgi:methylenetetrahydrofolate reductase (NADPH)